ncbi:MAG: hypothetical protein AAGC68_13355 [Verrucomicrobiota bacterium]
MRKLPVDLEELDEVFSELELSHPATADTPTVAFLDLSSGSVVRPESDRELEAWQGSFRYVNFPKAELNGLERYERVLDFVDTIDDGGLRISLDRLLRGRGALRRFREFLHSPEGETLYAQWRDFETMSRRDRIRDWLDEMEIESI